MALEITGKVVRILPEQSGKSAKTGNDWKRGSFIIETESNFPKKVCFTAWGDLTSQITGLQAGQNVKVSFDVESREFNEKWYTDLKAWKIDPAGNTGDSEGAGSVSAAGQGSIVEPAPGDSEESSDDLPF